MTKKELAGIYRRAAKLIDRGDRAYSCMAIDDTSWSVAKYSSYQGRLYIETLELPIDDGGFLVDRDFSINFDLNQCRQARVFMLLLMAEWVLTDWSGKF